MVTAIEPCLRWRDGVDARGDDIVVSGHQFSVQPGLASLLASPIPVSVATLIVGRELLEKLHCGRMLTWVLPCGELTALRRDVPLLRLEPGAAGEMSRFALVRRDGTRFIIESGRSDWMLLTDASSAADAVAGRGSPWLWGALLAAGMTNSDDPVETGSWLFHDRLFAQRSRADWLAPPSPWERPGGPAPDDAYRVPSSARGASHALPRPVPLSHEPSLLQATEGRRTPRSWSDQPLTQENLGALLWRTLRVSGSEVSDATKLDGTPVQPYEKWRRPVPSAGGLHGIDTWLHARNIEGVLPGWYWYDPLHHRISLVSESHEAPASTSAADGVLTARHRRYTWKYSGFAHALELKDAGVILHALQLSAIPLGLGVRPIGTGRTEFYARLLGIDTEVDMPVGDFQIGMPG